MIRHSEVLENVLTLDFVGFFCFLKYRFSLHIVGFDNTLPPSCLMRPGLGTRTVWHLCLLCGWSAGMFTQSVFGVTVGLCGLVFLFNALPDGAVLKRRETSPSPVASLASFFLFFRPRMLFLQPKADGLPFCPTAEPKLSPPLLLL